MQIFNAKLAKIATDEAFLRLGFRRTETKDDGGIIRDVSWDYETDKFWITVNCYYIVKLFRKNPDSDPIVIHVDDFIELKDIVDWVTDE